MSVLILKPEHWMPSFEYQISTLPRCAKAPLFGTRHTGWKVVPVGLPFVWPHLASLDQPRVSQGRLFPGGLHHAEKIRRTRQQVREVAATAAGMRIFSAILSVWSTSSTFSPDWPDTGAEQAGGARADDGDVECVHQAQPRAPASSGRSRGNRPTSLRMRLLLPQAARRPCGPAGRSAGDRMERCRIAVILGTRPAMHQKR